MFTPYNLFLVNIPPSDQLITAQMNIPLIVVIIPTYIIVEMSIITLQGKITDIFIKKPKMMRNGVFLIEISTHH